MFLREEHFLARPLQGAPLADVALQGAQHPVGEAARVVVLELAQQRHRHQRRRAPQQRHDVDIPDVGERVRSRAPIASRVLRRQHDSAVNTSGAALADAGLGRGQRLGLGLADVHVEADLLIGDVGSGHGADLF